jgi:lysophospholipase L1-like esterase
MNDVMVTVLIIGDSISMGYTPHVEARLAGQFIVCRNEGNAGDSRSLAEHLDEYLAACPDAAVIHFNCGLHDLKLARDGAGHQVPLAEYRENLGRIVKRLKATRATLIWGRTTPVNEVRHAASRPFDRLAADVDAYNAVADEVMTIAGVAINDLHAAVVEAGADDCLQDDGVHMTDSASAMLAACVAGAIVRAVSG